MRKIKQIDFFSKLREYNPYFFRQNGKNLIYPSEAGLKLGDLLLSYYQTSKNLLSLKWNIHG
jgi:hypothetical protein